MAPPYDYLLVYKYEGEGSEAGSLSPLSSLNSLRSLNTLRSFNSSGSEEYQDCQRLRPSGPLSRLYRPRYSGLEADHTDTVPGKKEWV